MIGRADWRWFWIVVASWAALIVGAQWPASWWLQVDRVRVMDAVAGETPEMEVRRTIKRPFRGEWIVTVMRKGKRGYFVFCTVTGANDYRPANQLPDHVDLDWWTWPHKCELPPGRYMVKTLWTIQTSIFPDKHVRIRSNPFDITVAD